MKCGCKLLCIGVGLTGPPRFDSSEVVWGQTAAYGNYGYLGLRPERHGDVDLHTYTL